MNLPEHPDGAFFGDVREEHIAAGEFVVSLLVNESPDSAGIPIFSAKVRPCDWIPVRS